MPINKNFILKTVGEENMIIPLVGNTVDMSKVFNINETGAWIFKKFSLNLSVEDVAKELSSEYDISYEEALEDVLSFSLELKKLGIYND